MATSEEGLVKMTREEGESGGCKRLRARSRDRAQRLAEAEGARVSSEQATLGAPGYIPPIIPWRGLEGITKDRLEINQGLQDLELCKQR